MCLPAGHEVHVAAAAEVDPAGPYFPAAHAEPRHVDELDDPSVSKYLPATQAEHTDAPEVEKVRGGHVKQATDPGLEYFPAMHAAQKSIDDAQRQLQDVPAGQSVQTEDPAESAYLPAWQGRQASKEVAPSVVE